MNRRTALFMFLIIGWGLALVGAALDHQPFPAEFLRRLAEIAATTGLLAAFLLAMWGVGRPIVRRLIPTATQFEQMFFSFTVGWGLLSLTTLTLGLMGLLWPATAWGLLAIGGAAALIQLQRSPLFRQLPIFPQLTIGEWFLISVISIGIAFCYFVYVATPPLAWDEVAYHLAVPKIYIAVHRIINVPYIAYSNSPFNLEMLFTLALLLRAETLPHYLVFSLSLLISAGLFYVGQTRFDRRTGLLAAALYWALPLIRDLSGVALVEIGLGFFTGAALYAFGRWLTGRASGWLVLTAWNCGLVAATKLPGAAVTLILGPALLIALVPQWKTSAGRKSALIALVIFGGIAALPVLPWYLKSYAFTHNPIWPFLNDWFGGRYWDALGDAYHFAYLRLVNLPAIPSNFLLGPWYLVEQPERFGGYALDRLILWLTPFAFLAVGHHQRRLVFGLTLFCVSFYTIWFFLTHQTRFLMPLIPPLCLLAALTAYRLWNSWFPWRVLLAGAFIAGLPGWRGPERNLWNTRLPYLSGEITRDDFLTAQVDAFTAFEYCNHSLPSDATLLLFPYENRGYYLEHPYVWGNLLTQRYIRFEQFADPAALYQGLRALGITHILDKPDFTHANFASGLTITEWDAIRQTMTDMERNYATLRFEKNNIFIYELNR